VAAEQAEAIILQMLENCWKYVATTTATANTRIARRPPPPEPTLKTFNIVLNCWARSEDSKAGYHAANVLDIMADWNNLCQKNNDNDVGCYLGCCPNERSLVSLIDAWTCSKHPDATKHTEAILQEAMSLTTTKKISDNSNKYRNVELGVPVFNAVIYFWVKSRRDCQAAYKAEEILQIMTQWANTRQRSTNEWQEAAFTGPEYTYVLDDSGGVGTV
jgi:hypothetical protein